MPDQPELTLQEIIDRHLHWAKSWKRPRRSGRRDALESAAWHEAAARKLEALAGQGWIEAPNLPPSLESIRAWRWEPALGTMDVTFIPRGYDRRPSACGRIWFWPLPQPEPPAEES
jgi:hypothetical protein